MTTHADSQMTDADAVEALLSALRSPEHAGSLTLVRARSIGAREMLGRWRLETPDGSFHRVAIVDVVDGEVLGFDQCYYRSEDAIAVWDHLAAAAAEAAAEG